MAAAYLKTFSIVLLCIICFADAGVYPNYHSFSEFKPIEIPKKWWQTSSFYQIYPRSFKDSNGDGVGDLNGITDKLEYLREIGVNATWLSPIFTSPMADFGYDIANFTEIDPLFGTMQDFEALLEKAKRLGVRILLDFVPNHSSDEHEWFKKSASGDPEYKDFYVWHPGKLENGVRKPPNNWVSVFHGSAWEWHPGRQEYYLHQFVKKQPDLNYRNPKVHEAMKEVLLFWLRKGVSGFRVDAVPHVYEVAPDADGNFPDEPTNDWNPDPDDYGHLNHIYTKDQPETIALVYEWRHVLDEFRKENGGDERILMAEAYSPIDVEMKYYGNATAEGAQVPFNFLIISWLTNSSDANHYVEAINTWLKNMPAGRTANWVVGNHDQSRVGSRLGRDRIDMMSMLILTLPGCSVTYNGEELGMTDVWISWNDTVDPSACNTNPSVYEKFSRDPERTPFQWSDEPNAGFSSANKTWLPIADNYKEVNVKVQRAEARSHLNVFKNLQAIRQDTTIQNGDATVKVVNNAVVAVKRSLINAHTFVTLMNIFDGEQKLDLNQVFSDMPKEFQYVVVTERSTAKIGDVIKSTEVLLLPKEAVVLKSTTKLATFAGYFTYYVSKS